MGNVACCKKPNEVIEDRDLFKKTTLKRKIILIKIYQNLLIKILDFSKIKIEKDKI